MTWHATEKYTEVGKMQHLVGGRAWKNFDTRRRCHPTPHPPADHLFHATTPLPHSSHLAATSRHTTITTFNIITTAAATYSDEATFYEHHLATSHHTDLHHNHFVTTVTHHPHHHSFSTTTVTSTTSSPSTTSHRLADHPQGCILFVSAPPKGALVFCHPKGTVRVRLDVCSTVRVCLDPGSTVRVRLMGCVAPQGCVWYKKTTQGCVWYKKTAHGCVWCKKTVKMCLDPGLASRNGRLVGCETTKRMSARGHGSNGGGDDRPFSRQIFIGCRGREGQKPNRGGMKADRLRTYGETWNLRLRKIMDE
uniref:Uncharacterized protein n=1 Tax=Tanacetum cinerariifolium TaxID=118510 RepID=A0A699HK74_TANCI|nr:hypothetical protein [Tanacetum cinerariifolium]